MGLADDMWRENAAQWRLRYYQMRARNRALERVVEIVRPTGNIAFNASSNLSAALAALDATKPTQYQEVRLNDDGTIDEVVVGGLDSVHLEQMDDDTYWIGLNRGDKSLDMNLFARKRRKLRMNISDEGIGVTTTLNGVEVCGQYGAEDSWIYCRKPVGHEGPCYEAKEQR